MIARSFVVLLVLGVVGAVTAAPADDGRLPPTLRISGRSTVSGGERPSVVPIYSITFGDVARAEKIAAQSHSLFGPYAVDAVIWTPVQDFVRVWKATDFRRPTTDEEVARFARSPELFKAELIETKDILPFPLNRLKDAALAQIEFIVRYRAGGIHAALVIGTTAEQAEALVELLRELQK